MQQRSAATENAHQSGEFARSCVACALPRGGGISARCATCLARFATARATEAVAARALEAKQCRSDASSPTRGGKMHVPGVQGADLADAERLPAQTGELWRARKSAAGCLPAAAGTPRQQGYGEDLRPMSYGWNRAGRSNATRIGELGRRG